MPPSWLPLLIGIALLAALATHSLRMRRSGVNPWALPTGDDAHGFLGRAFFGLTAIHLFVLLTWAVSPGWSRRTLGFVPVVSHGAAA